MPAVTVKNNAQNINITNNNITASGASYVYGVMMNDNVANIIVNNNNVAAAGPLYVAGIDASTANNSRISNNKITAVSSNPTGNYSAGEESLAYGVILATYNTGNHDNTVNANTINLTANVAYAIENIYGTQNNINNNIITVNAKRGLGIATHTSNNNHYDNNNIIINCNQDTINNFYEMITPTNVGIIIINSTGNQINNNQIRINENSTLNITYAIILDENSTNNFGTNNQLFVYNINGIAKQGMDAISNDNILNDVSANSQNIIKKALKNNIKEDSDTLIINEDNIQDYITVTRQINLTFNQNDNMNASKIIIEYDNKDYEGYWYFRKLANTQLQIISSSPSAIGWLGAQNNVTVVNSYLPQTILSSNRDITYINCTFLDLDNKYNHPPILENTNFIVDKINSYTLSHNTGDTLNFITTVYSDLFESTTNILKDSINANSVIYVTTPYYGYQTLTIVNGQLAQVTIFNNPIIFNKPVNFTSLKNVTWSGDITFVAGSEGSNITDMTLNGTVYINTTNIGLYNNTINKGVVLTDSSESNLIGNTFNTEAEAITFSNTIQSVVENNTINSNADFAVVLDGESLENSIVDNTIITPVNMGNSAVNGDKESNTIKNNKPVKEANIKVIAPGTANINEATPIIVMLTDDQAKVIPEEPVTVSLDDVILDTVVTDEYGMVVFNFTPTVDGELTLIFDHEETGYSAVSSSVVILVHEDKDAIIQELNDTVNNLTEEIENLTAPKETIITLEPIDGVKYNDEITITGSLTTEDDLCLNNQIITITIGDKSAKVTTNNGVFEYATVIRSMGEKTVTVTYNGNDKYESSDATITFDVAKQDAVITVDPIMDVVLNEEVTITGTFTDANGKALTKSTITVTYNGKSSKVVTDDSGVFTYTAKATVAGENTVTFSYGGFDKFNPVEVSETFNVNKRDAIITINPIEDYIYNDTVTITGTFKDANGNVLGKSSLKVTINGVKQTVKTDENGVFTITTTATTTGINNITVSYGGYDKYNEVEETATFTVNKKDVKVTVTDIVVNNTRISITGKFSDASGNVLSNSQVMVTLNGKKTYVNTDSEGVYVYNGWGQDGQNVFTVGYSGSNNYNTYTSQETKLTVSKN